MRELIAKKFLYKDKEILRRFSLLSKLSTSSDEIYREEKVKLSAILKHAIKYVPFYIEWASNKNILVKDIDDNPYAMLELFPVIDKEIIRHDETSFISEDIVNRNSYTNYTGGSSGEPFKFIQDSDFHKWNESIFLLSKTWRGWSLGAKEILLWGSDKDTFSGKKSIKAKLKDLIYNRCTLNTFSLSSEIMREYIQIIDQQKPQMIRAYAQSIYQMALFMNENGISLKYNGAIHTGAGTLYNHMRAEITKAFRTKEIYNHYGSRELGSIASECSSHTGMHIFTNHNFVEIMDESNQPVNDGKVGNIVATSLNNYSMPLIRYKIGDVGKKSIKNCECEIAYPMLEEVIGRSTDILKASDGTIVLPEYMIHLIGVSSNDGSISKFQIIQDRLGHIQIKVVLRNERSLKEALQNEITSKIQILMGETSVEFREVSDIAKTSSGKYLYIKSNLD